MPQLLHLRLPPGRPRAPAHAPSRAAAPRAEAADVQRQPEVDPALDQAAALWTTRRIRCFLLMLPGRKPDGSTKR